MATADSDDTDTEQTEVTQNGDETVVEGPNAAEQEVPQGTDADYNQGRADAKSAGTVISGKIEEDNDDGPRSKVELKIKGSGPNAEAAIKDYAAAAEYAREEGLHTDLHEMRKDIRTPEDTDDE
jgi:hypothetical protein